MKTDRVKGANVGLVKNHGFVSCERGVLNAFTQQTAVGHVHNLSVVAGGVVKAHSISDPLALRGGRD